MNCMRRALLHNVRKKGKTCLLFSILLVIGIMLLACISIQRAAQTAALNVRQSLKGAFSIDAKATDGQLTDEVIQDILKLPGIISYNGRSASYAEYLHEDGTPLEVMTEGAFQVVEGFEHAGKVVADSFSEKDELFTEGGFELLSRAPVAEGEHHTAVIHRQLAEKNNLQIGDIILLRLNSQMLSDDVMNAEGTADKTIPVKISGIFESTEPQEGTALLSHVFYQNTVFIDHQSYSELFPQNDSVYCESAEFQADDPETLDELIGQIKKIDGVAWEKCVFIKHAADYERARDSLCALEQIMFVLTLVTLGVSAGLLILIFALWVRSRVHETGVYTAMGIRKGNVLLQQIIEACMTAVCAFAAAVIVSGGAARAAGEHMLRQTAVPEYEAEKVAGVGQAEQMQGQQEDIVELTQIQIHVSAQDILLLYGAGILVIILSVTASAVPVLQLKPKEILTKMN